MKDFENMKKTPEKLREFFENPYMEEMLRSNNDMLNYSVMRIMSACELLEGGDGAKISDERRRCTNRNYPDGCAVTFCVNCSK